MSILCQCCVPAKSYLSNKSLRRHQAKTGVRPLTWFEAHKREYELNPPVCINCYKAIPYSKGSVRQKFCNQTCSGSYNGSRRKHTEISKKNIAKSLAAHRAKNPQPKREPKLYTRVCEICSMSFTHHNSKIKYCGQQCYRKGLSITRIKYLKENAGTFNWIPNNKPTYFEQSFFDWLDSAGYSQQYIGLKQHFYNEEQSTSYWLDVYFPEIRLNIELDGTHHELPKQLQRDTIRDEYLSRVHNVRIHRISIRDYNKKGGRQVCWDEALKIIESM